MLVMTAKVNKKKIAVIAAAAAGLLLAILLIFGGGDDAAETAAYTSAGNDSRLLFLKSMGWDVSEAPVQSGQVKVPSKQSEVFDRYNTLQKAQGYDLTQYAGKTVSRYVYQVYNYPGATDPVYATVLVYKDKIIGGDVTNTATKGVIQGFKKPATSNTPETTPESGTDKSAA